MLSPVCLKKGKVQHNTGRDTAVNSQEFSVPAPASLYGAVANVDDESTVLGGLFVKPHLDSVERFRVLLYITAKSTLDLKHIPECTNKFKKVARKLGIGSSAFVEFALDRLNAQGVLCAEPFDTVVVDLLARCRNSEKCPFNGYPNIVLVSALLGSLVRLSRDRREKIFDAVRGHLHFVNESSIPGTRHALYVIRASITNEKATESAPTRMLHLPEDAFSNPQSA